MMTENLHTKDCIRTFTGKYVNIFDIDPDTLVIEDIAHALAQEPRFGGHLPKPYSVAQHSVWCHDKLKEAGFGHHKPYLMQALMHDASEAYLKDLPKPIKNRIPGYKKLEDNLMEAIAKKFGFLYPLTGDIKYADKKALQYEWDNIMLTDPSESNVVCWSFVMAKHEFLERYKKLI